MSEIDEYKLLSPRYDVNRLVPFLLKCIEMLRREGNSYESIVNMINKKGIQINHSTFNSFMSRRQGESFRRTNKSIHALYNYFVRNAASFNSELTFIIREMEEDASSVSKSDLGITKKADFSEHLFADLIRGWIGTSQKTIERSEKNICGDFYMFRKSVRVEKTIVCSALYVKKDGNGDLKVSHVHYDRSNRKRVSKGVLITTATQYFSILSIEGGASIEFIALQRPMYETYSQISGFIITINTNRALVCSRIFVEKMDLIDKNVMGRFKIDNYQDDKFMIDVLDNLCSDQAMSLPDQTDKIEEKMIICGLDASE